MNEFNFIVNDAIKGLVFAFASGIGFGSIFGLIRFIVFTFVERKEA